MKYSSVFFEKVQKAFDKKRPFFIEQTFYPKQISCPDVYCWYNFVNFRKGMTPAGRSVLWRVKWKNLQKTDFVE